MEDREFFKVMDLEEVLALTASFKKVSSETVGIGDALFRVAARDIKSEEDLPGFIRSTMDGYAVKAASTFGASESNPAYLDLKGEVLMGEVPSFEIRQGEAARISTGGMLPAGADSVVMVEHTALLDSKMIEVYKSVAPAQNTILPDEDYAKNETVIGEGTLIRPQEIGVMAALGIKSVPVFLRPRVGIVSTGDEVVPVSEKPLPGMIRDVNSYTIAAQVKAAGGIPMSYGIVRDSAEKLLEVCRRALKETDMLLVSGGSSVGARDYTVSAFESLENSSILVHGISISPGKPAILCRAMDKPVWGLPGQVTSAMVVFEVVVMPFLDRIAGRRPRFAAEKKISAVLSRNLASANGRTDFVRVRLTGGPDPIAEPLLGKSGLINTMVKADGLVEIPKNSEGLDAGTPVKVRLFS